MELRGDKLDFGERGRRSRPWRILFYLALIIGGIYFAWLVNTRTVQPLFLPTPTATRNSYSHALEGKALFSAGDLGKATEAYQFAVELDPENARLRAELARVLIYFSELKPSYSERLDTLLEARAAADLAVELDPDDSFAHAVRALAYDWLAAADEVNRQGYLTEASSAAEFARFLASDDAFALAVYAEVQVDLQKYAQAAQYAELAADTVDSQSEYAVDVYRIYGTVLESLGAYNSAIEQYMRAAEAAPNLTFLYIRIGVNYRRLNKATEALTFFNKAAEMNSQLKIQDPIPYLAIARTYLQMGEFFISALNVERALAFNPANPDIYGLLGVVFYKARNYESSISVLKCAVDGCSPEESVEVLCDFVFLCGSDPLAEGIGNQVQGLDLNSESLVYYYTYGSALAYYSGSEGYEFACDDAERIFSQLMASQYGSDPIVSAIVAEGRAILAESCGVASSR
jgi:tetratricopeptide (TPR) repeat protein